MTTWLNISAGLLYELVGRLLHYSITEMRRDLQQFLWSRDHLYSLSMSKLANTSEYVTRTIRKQLLIRTFWAGGRSFNTFENHLDSEKKTKVILRELLLLPWWAAILRLEEPWWSEADVTSGRSGSGFLFYHRRRTLVLLAGLVRLLA